jgi:hypothetical protein
MPRNTKKNKKPVKFDDYGNPLWEVEALQGKKIMNEIPYYFVKWAGYPESDNTWEPYSNLEEVKGMVEEYER